MHVNQKQHIYFILSMHSTIKCMFSFDLSASNTLRVNHKALSKRRANFALIIAMYNHKPYQINSSRGELCTLSQSASKNTIFIFQCVGLIIATIGVIIFLPIGKSCHNQMPANQRQHI